jgi:plasmid stabilization system protein ParE
MGHAENFAEAEAALETLEAEIDRLTDELRALKDECQEAVGE